MRGERERGRGAVERGAGRAAGRGMETEADGSAGGAA